MVSVMFRRCGVATRLRASLTYSTVQHVVENWATEMPLPIALPPNMLPLRHDCVCEVVCANRRRGAAMARLDRLSKPDVSAHTWYWCMESLWKWYSVVEVA
jgi:hypothetical protein